MGLYVLLSAIVTGLARVGFGADQALAPRYVTISSLLWAGLLVGMARASSQRTASRSGRALALGFVCLVSARLAWRSLVEGPEVFRQFHTWSEPVRRELIAGDDETLLAQICADAALVRARREVLRRYGLSAFREPRR